MGFTKINPSRNIPLVILTILVAAALLYWYSSSHASSSLHSTTNLDTKGRLSGRHKSSNSQSNTYNLAAINSKMSHDSVALSAINLTGKDIPEDIQKKRDSTVVTEHTTMVDNLKVFYRESLPAGTPKEQVLLLHGQAFSSENWLDLGTLAYIAAMGHRAVAIDIPGYGNSVHQSFGDPVAFMTELISSLQLSTPVIISPSMSGGLSLPFLTTHPDMVKGYIPVAPVTTGRYKSKYPSVKTPTLIVYGDRDMRLGKESVENLSLLLNHSVQKLPNAGHAAYMNQPDLWHKLIYNFLQAL